MTLYWIYDLPNWLFGILTVIVFNTIAIGGLYLTRPIVKRLLKGSSEHNDAVSWFFAAVGVFYGLAVGLIAIATWQDFTDADALVGKEAATLAGLYRDFDGYPAELHHQLERELRAYAEEIVKVEWPAHRQGLVPEQGTELLDALENKIMAFEPKRESEKISHTEVIRSLNDVVQARRGRMQAVKTGLPAELWTVVLIGAVLNFLLLYLFWIDNRTLHVVLISLFATLVGLLIFLTAAMDNPFRGQFSVAPDAIQAVIDSVMNPTT